MKTFDDLEERPSDFIQRWGLDFDNGYGISVIKGKFTYSNAKTYEVAVIKGENLCYTTPITDDVLGYQTPEQITEIMKELQSYERDQY